MSFSVPGVIDRLRRVVRHADGNVSGQSYGLTAFMPILPGEAAAVRRHLEELPVGPDSPLGRLRRLHCSRLHVLEDLVYQGEPQEPETLRSAYLIFTASFDGELDALLDDICDTLPDEADAIFGRCIGYAGTADRAEFRRYVKHNQIHNHYYLTPYPEATVRDVRQGLDARRQVADFAASAQGMDDAALQQAFMEKFAR
jgi:hypothetical protein